MGGVRDWTREQLLRCSGGFSLPSALIAMISFDFTTVLLRVGVIRENNDMSQALIPLKWQTSGQRLLGPINPLCGLEQVSTGWTQTKRVLSAAPVDPAPEGSSSS